MLFKIIRLTTVKKYMYIFIVDCWIVVNINIRISSQMCHHRDNIIVLFFQKYLHIM